MNAFQAGIIRVANIAAHPSNLGRDLGDLRELTASVAERGVLVPVVLERHGDRYRLRDGHRRLAAARLAKVASVPAIIHAEELDEADWLLESVEYNTQRAGYTAEDRKRVASRLLELGVSRASVARAFGLTTAKLADLLNPKPAPPANPRRPPAVVARRTVLHAVQDWRSRGVDAATILAELERLLEPPPSENGADHA